MRKLLVGLLFPLVLLLTQQAAVLHPLGHLEASQAQTDDDHQHPAGALCAACLAFSSAAIGLSTQTAWAPLRADLAHALPRGLRHPTATVDAPSARSRGPPALL
jgi:hypothetical protein